MPHFDMPLDQLRTYQPPLTARDDFDDFWEGTLLEAASHALNAQFEPVELALTTVDAYDVTFSGYGGQRIKGWLLLPAVRNAPLPCIVEYIGYGGGRGYPHDWLTWSAYGYAHLVMDTRGQGSWWLHGDTPDETDDGNNPQHPGFMTRGIMSPQSYYYRRLMIDAVRAVDVVRDHPAIAEDQIVVTGISQGGGLTVAVAGLRDDLAGTMADVPFLCNYERAIRLIETEPYNEIAHYLKIHRDKVAQTTATLSYFDGINFAARATAPMLYSVGLMDDICPPSTVFAAYNHHAAQKDIRIYEFNNHEGGASHHVYAQLAFLQEIGIGRG